MTWTLYRLSFRLLAPLHIGWFKQGNVQRTRPYVTGKALWGALTARLARDIGSNDYTKLGDQVSNQLAFSYFYPSTAPSCVCLWPWDDPEGFAWRYLSTYASTALDPEHNTAKEGTLHETECLSPHTRDGEPVYLVGYIFERAGCTLTWRDALARLQLGGERTRGWGRVQPHGEPQRTTDFWQGWDVDLSAQRPALRCTSSNPRCFAHLAVDQSQDVAGDLEPLVGRQTAAADQHGERLVAHGLFWQPGAQVSTVAEPLHIVEYGLWKPA
ncbi:MAG: hypothetical protein NZL92_11715 [Gloeomargarita sp. SKYG116]|nr:hypothetical protein [Gloeomargarita sp. SKYG116]MDW8402349.1 hypothetical protein [Gloeomargarita sp. SKYGB_i_bin116]